MGFMDERSSAYPSVKFETKGVVVSGTLIDEPKSRMMTGKFSPEPEKTWCFNLLVDGEKRTLYVKEVGFLAAAIQEAVEEASAKVIEVGATLQVAWTEDVDTGKGNPAKDYKAKYTPPASGTKASDIFGSGENDGSF